MEARVAADYPYALDHVVLHLSRLLRHLHVVASGLCRTGFLVSTDVPKHLPPRAGAGTGFLLCRVPDRTLGATQHTWHLSHSERCLHVPLCHRDRLRGAACFRDADELLRPGRLGFAVRVDPRTLSYRDPYHRHGMGERYGEG